MKNYNDYLETLGQKDFERIDRYAREQMDPEDKKAFENELAENPSMLKEVQLHQKMIAALEVTMYLQEKQLQTSDRDNAAPVKKMQTFQKRWLAAASVILLLAVAAFWYILTPSGNEQLYASYFKADPGMPTNMGIENAYEFDRGMVDYKTGEYQQAIDRWESLYRADSSDSKLAYFLGVAWLNLGGTDKSIPYLEKVAEDKLTAFQQSAIWYQALAYIKKDNNKKAIELLKLIPDYPAAPELQQKLHQVK